MSHNVVEAGPTKYTFDAMRWHPDQTVRPRLLSLRRPGGLNYLSDARNILDAPLGVNPAEALKEHVAGAQC